MTRNREGEKPFNIITSFTNDGNRATSPSRQFNKASATFLLAQFYVSTFGAKVVFHKSGLGGSQT